MNSFSKKQLKPSQRVCLRLKEARLAANMPLAEPSRLTKVSTRHLLALEECRFQDIHCADIYKKNFIKRYAHALKIDPKTLVDQFLEEEVMQKNETQHTHIHVHRSRMYNVPLALQYTGIILLLTLCFGYLGLQVKRIVEPPQLQVYSPKNGHITEDHNLLVYGEVENEAQVEINGETIIKNDSGQFKQEITLSPGINTIIISAKKKHGKTKSETRHVILRQQLQQFSFEEADSKTTTI